MLPLPFAPINAFDLPDNAIPFQGVSSPAFHLIINRSIKRREAFEEVADRFG